MNESWFALLLEFLENSWNFVIFFQGPGKLLEKQLFSLYSWNSPGILWKMILYYRKTTYILPKLLTCNFFNIDSIIRSFSGYFRGILSSFSYLAIFVAAWLLRLVCCPDYQVEAPRFILVDTCSEQPPF